MAQEKQAVDAFSAWADQNRREEVVRLLGGKPFEVTPDNVLGWLKLMQEWQQARGGQQKKD